MSSDSYMDEIQRYLRETFAGASSGIGPDESLLGDVLDSMGILTLVSHLEDTYGIAIGAHEMDPSNFATLRTLSGFVARKAAGK